MPKRDGKYRMKQAIQFIFFWHPRAYKSSYSLRDQCLLIAVSVVVENAYSQVELTLQTSFTQSVLLPLHFRRGAGLAAVHAEAEPLPARGGRPVREWFRDHAHVLGRNSVELGNS